MVTTASEAAVMLGSLSVSWHGMTTSASTCLPMNDRTPRRSVRRLLSALKTSRSMADGSKVRLRCWAREEKNGLSRSGTIRPTVELRLRLRARPTRLIW
jgi:hypothetical protein